MSTTHPKAIAAQQKRDQQKAELAAMTSTVLPKGFRLCHLRGFHRTSNSGAVSILYRLSDNKLAVEYAVTSVPAGRTFSKKLARYYALKNFNAGAKVQVSLDAVAGVHGLSRSTITPTEAIRHLFNYF